MYGSLKLTALQFGQSSRCAGKPQYDRLNTSSGRIDHNTEQNGIDV